MANQGGDDAARYSVGVRYRLTPAWLLRTGYARDMTPIPSIELRTPRIPDMDRDWYTVGVRWQATPAFSIDGSYACLMGQVYRGQQHR